MSKYLPTIGLEIHAELKTQTKMFCDSRNDTNEERPNVNVCPICMGHPGTLPTINKEAVKQVLKVGVAVDGKLADYTEFDRKNYFYPDIPKGYQISQYKNPLVSGGKIAGVDITRIHLEEDTAKSMHDKGEESLVDFNRAGVPLMELVTEPVIHDAGVASQFAKELQLLLRYLGVSEANMEKGEMRVEANISVSRSNLDGTDFEVRPFGTKVEVKNLNSFKAVEKAIKYELERQTALLDRGEKVVQETRGWDENKEKTYSQRTKEDSHDYRYFPDPDLPSLKLSEIKEFDKKVIKESLSELPWEKRERFKKNYGLRDEDVEIYVNDVEKGSYFESVAKVLEKKELIQTASNYILTDIKKFIPVSSVVEIVRMIDRGELSSRGAKDLFKVLPETEVNVIKFAEEKNLIQKSDSGEIKRIAHEVVRANPNVKIVDFLVGQGMKLSKGSANPQLLKQAIEKLL